MLNHNKKRNVGLLSEFFSKYIADSLVSQKYENIERAKKVYMKYFSENTEIKKEAKLFSILYSTNVSSKEIAHALMQKVKNLCESENRNIKKLEDEKTRLLHEINSSFGDKEFFNRSVPDYKIQGAIQVLLNTWRTKSLAESISEIATLEDNILNHLTESKILSTPETSSYLEMTNEEVDGLVLGIMTEKFNTKFSSELSESQRAIISSYAFYENKEQKDNLNILLESLRQESLSLIDSTLKKNEIEKEPITEKLQKKLTGIKNMLLNEYKDVTTVNDDSMAFYMTLTKLQKELGHD